MNTETATRSRRQVPSRENGEERRSGEHQLLRDGVPRSSAGRGGACEGTRNSPSSEAWRRASLRRCGASRPVGRVVSAVSSEAFVRLAACVRCRFIRNRKNFEKAIDRREWQMVSDDQEKPIIWVRVK